VDKRVQKTQQLILRTFLDLLNEKGFSKITVNDLAERANINRGTVYLHYVDKFDLLDKCIEAYVEPLVQYCSPTPSPEANGEVLRGMFGYLEQHRAVFATFLSSETVGFLRNRLSRTLSQALIGGNDQGVATQFLTAGFVGVLEWWVGQPTPCSVQQITEQLAFLMGPYSNRLHPHSITRD